MVKRRKPADYNRKIQFYETTGDFVSNPETNQLEPEYVPFKKLWCNVETIFREQLQASIEGTSVVRDRKQITTRYRRDLKSDMRFELNGQEYTMSMIGDPDGFGLEIRFLGEAIVDGGS